MTSDQRLSRKIAHLRAKGKGAVDSKSETKRMNTQLHLCLENSELMLMLEHFGANFYVMIS